MPNNIKLALNISQIFLHLIVIYGYLVAIIPGAYFTQPVFLGLSGFLVVPTSLIISSVLAFHSGNRTTAFVIFNLLMSLLAIVPLLGYIGILLGLVTTLVVGIAIFPTLFTQKALDLNEKVVEAGKNVGINLNTHGVVNKYAQKNRNQSIDIEITKK